MSTPTTVGASDVSLNVAPTCVKDTFQRKSFFALGRHWIFYVDVAGNLVYDSSVGASEVWLGAVALTPQALGSEFTVWLQFVSPTVAYVHLVRADSTGNTPIYYHRGTLASDGTIVWDAEDEAVPLDAGWEYENLGICMDWSGNIYVVYNKVLAANPNICTPYICQSTTYDGTWTTGAGYPLQITAVPIGSWIPVVSAYGTGVMVVYTTTSGSIYSRVMSAGVWGAQVDTLFDIGADARAISIVSASVRSGLASPTATAVIVAFQAADWDLYSIRYENDAWQGAPANTIQVIGNFREANPMLSILDFGTEDVAPTTDHPPATLYCFWTPTTDSPTAEWVTYRVSRDLGDTWTNEAEADAAVSWIDETADGFEVQASGSAYYRSSADYDRARSYIGIVYVTHRMPPALRHAALGFNDPDEDLLGVFTISQPLVAELLGVFIVRHVDGEEDLLGVFNARHTDLAELLGVFNARHVDGDENLLGVFSARRDGSAELPGEFSARRDGDAELLGVFSARRDGSAELFCGFIIGQWFEELYGMFDSGQDSADLLGIFIARRDGDEELKGEFVAQRDGDAEILGIFLLVNIGDEELKGEFVARRDGDEELKGQFVARRDGDAEILGIFNARHTDLEELLGVFVIRKSASEDLPAQFRIDQDVISKGLNVDVYRDLGVIS